MRENVKISKIRYIIETDDYPDTSYYGQYTDKAAPWNIERRRKDYVHNLAKSDFLDYWKDSLLEDRIEVCRDYGFSILAARRNAPPELNDNDILNFYEPKIERLNEYGYFKPSETGEPEGSENYQKYGLKNYKRIEKLSDGYTKLWYCMRIGAEALIDVKIGDGDCWLRNVISSGGVCGIESDSGEDFIGEIKFEQLLELKAVLLALGFDEEEIDEASKNIETIEK